MNRQKSEHCMDKWTKSKEANGKYKNIFDFLLPCRDEIREKQHRTLGFAGSFGLAT